MGFEWTVLTLTSKSRILVPVSPLAIRPTVELFGSGVPLMLLVLVLLVRTVVWQMEKWNGLQVKEEKILSGFYKQAVRSSYL